MSGCSGFVLVVDSAKVAGWLSGRSGLAAGAHEEMVSMAPQAWEALELLVMYLGSHPLATEWVAWVPREANQGADCLATRALETRRDAWFWHARWQQFRRKEVVICSDAGLRRPGGEAVQVGLGWVMLERSTGYIVAAASWALTPSGVAAEDFNRWELRAALAGMGALTCLRAGRVGEVWQGDRAVVGGRF